MGPLDRIDEILPERVRRIVGRETPIPTIAGRAAIIAERQPALVRADIGQIAGVAPEGEVLYGPPVGLTPLRTAIAELYTHAFGLSEPLTGANVAMCTGAAEALTVLFHVFGSGRRVLLPRPSWENYLNALELAGGEPVFADLFDGAGKLLLDRIAAAAADGIRTIVVNFPCNPSGIVLDGDETAALAQVVRDNDLVVLADEVYARLRYDGAPPQSLIAHAPSHAVSIGSASKEYLLPGARVGYVVCARSDLTDRVLRKLIRANTASPSVLGQRALLERLEPDLADLRAGKPPRLFSQIAEAMASRRDALLEVLTRHAMAPTGRAPQGTIFLMAPLPSWWAQDDVAFCEAALDAEVASFIPGSAFGVPGTVRLSYGALDADAIGRLDRGLAQLAAL